MVHLTRQSSEIFVLFKTLTDQHLRPIDNYGSSLSCFSQESGVLWCVNGIKDHTIMFQSFLQNQQNTFTYLAYK